jgi:hypothetical protein
MRQHLSLSGNTLGMGKPELKGEIRGGTTGAPRDVHEQRLELRHTLDALIKVLDACTQEVTSDQRRRLQN